MRQKKAAGFMKRRVYKVESQEAVKRKDSCVHLDLELRN